MDKDVKLAVTLPSKCEFLSPKCTQEGEQYLQSGNQQTAATPYGGGGGVQLLIPVYSWLLANPRTKARQVSCHSPSPGVCSNSCPLSWWCHPTISSSVVPFSCLQSFQASGSFLMTQLFISGDQRIGISASASLLMNTQDWFPLFFF